MKSRTFAQDGVAVLGGDSGGPWVVYQNGWVQVAVEKGGISQIAPSSKGLEIGASVGNPTVRNWILGVIGGGSAPPPCGSCNVPPPPIVDPPPTVDPPSGGGSTGDGGAPSASANYQSFVGDFNGDGKADIGLYEFLLAKRSSCTTPPDEVSQPPSRYMSIQLQCTKP